MDRTIESSTHLLFIYIYIYEPLAIVDLGSPLCVPISQNVHLFASSHPPMTKEKNDVLFISSYFDHTIHDATYGVP